MKNINETHFIESSRFNQFHLVQTRLDSNQERQAKFMREQTVDCLPISLNTIK